MFKDILFTVDLGHCSWEKALPVALHAAKASGAGCTS